MTSGIEIAHFNIARGSFDILRQKITIIFFTQSVLGRSWLDVSRRDFSQARVNRFVPALFPSGDAFVVLGKKFERMSSFVGREKKPNREVQFSSIFVF